MEISPRTLQVSTADLCNERILAALVASEVVSAVLNLEGEITAVSASMAGIFGQEASALVGHPLETLFDTTRLPWEWRKVVVALRQHARWEGEGCFLAPTGLRRCFALVVTAVSDEEGSLCHGLLALREITQQVEEREKWKQALLDSDARWQFALESSGDGLWVLDLPAGKLSISDRWREFLGYAEDDLGDDVAKWSQLVHPEDSARSMDKVLRHIAGETENFVNEQRVRCKDGTYKWILDSGKVLQRAADGSPLLLMGTLRDISERREFENRLRESEARFRGAFESSGIGMALVDLTGRWVEVNASVCRIVGYDKETLVNLTFQDITHPDDLEKDLDLLHETLDGKRSHYQMEKRYRHAEGHIVWVYLTVSLIRDGEGNPVHFVSQIEDITERRRLEEHLRETRERLSLALRIGGVGIWDWDCGGNRLTWDDQMFKLYGLTPETLVPHFDGWVERLHPEDRERTVREVSGAKEGGADFDTEFRIVTPDGCERHLRAISLVQHDAQGNPTRMLGTNWDVTDMVNQREELRRLAEKANQASEAKSQFLANMSHEIRTPMNGVIGMTHLLLDTPGLTEEQRQIAETIQSSGESLMALLNDILDFSKVESGMLELEELDFDLRKLMSELAALLRGKAAEKSLRFSCSAATEVPGRLRGDAGRLRQILLNLAGNAIKFTPAGSVQVEADLVEETEHDALIHFCVRDTGIGIPLEVQGRLFKAFTQADASTTRNYGGTGLGLAICRQLTELMGGEIGVDSEEGKGADFWFRVRLQKQAHDEEAPPETDFVGVSILVVEHDEALRLDIADRLRSWNAVPVLCSGGLAALDILYQAAEKGDPIPAVLIEQDLPRMDGFALARAIRTDEMLKRTRLVLLTEMGRADELASISTRNFDAHTFKPIRPSDLYDALAELLKSGDNRVVDEMAARMRRLQSCGARVLLAEDNHVNQAVACGILNRFGLRVDVVANGVEALESLASIPYDLVLMDVQMPELDGLEASRAIRLREKRSGCPKVPIVAMTAHARPEDREQCLQAGMDDYVAKPISPPELASVLDRWLCAQTAVQEAAAHRQPTAVPTRPLVDFDEVLNRMMRDEGLMEGVLNIALSESTHVMRQIQSAFNQRDFSKAAAYVHSLKGLAGNAGLAQLGHLAETMQTMLHEGREAQAVQIVPELATVHTATLRAIERFLDRPEV
ncbi:MAG: PAS domain S-box protein [Verrucomicrobiota bacterium JB022]|nr:PAS domain S-box protein [Verrucomicrobiota bacterium JB022]